MDKMERDEKLWGGILGIIAILAAIAEMFINGPDAASFVGAVKDVSGTLIVVILLVAFLKNLPRKPKNLTEILEKAVEDWGLDNAPLIFKIEGYRAAQNSKCSQGFCLLQQPKSYIFLANKNITPDSPEWLKYAQYGNGKLTGKFLDMPSYEMMTKEDFEIVFIMEQSHFKNESTTLTNIEQIALAVGNRFKSTIKSSDAKSYKLRLTYSKIETEQDVAAFVDSLDFVLSLVKVIL